MNFYNHAQTVGLTVNTRKLKVGWGKHTGSLSPILLQAIQSGASRNVYIGSISDFEVYTEAKLRQDFAEYGGVLARLLTWVDRGRTDQADIEMINFLKEKGAAFIN